MGTRCGDMDPAVILHIMGREELSLHEANTLLNKHSGLIGISGVSSDMREILSASNDSHTNAKLALEIYCYRLKKYIGSYIAAMNGLDNLVFTGGVGENSPDVRALTCQGMEYLGIKIDQNKNLAAKAVEADVAADDSRARILVIPTNEELVIARDTLRLMNQQKSNNPR